MPNSFEAKEAPKLTLSEPSVVFRDSYLEAAKEFEAVGEWKKDWVDNLENHFDEHINELQRMARGEQLDPNKVAQFTFWLVENQKYIGSVRIRPELNEQLEKIGGNVGCDIRPSERRKGYATEMVGMALEKARELGLKEVIMTCDEENIGSQKVIEANGGQLLESNVNIEEWPHPFRKYKVVLENLELRNG